MPAMYYRGLPSLHLSTVSWYVPSCTKLFFSNNSFSVCLHLNAYGITITLFVGEWHEENMEINYVQEHPKAVLRADHAASIRLQLEETLGTFNGFFFVTLYLNAAVQRVSFGYVTRQSTFNDVRFRLHVLRPYSQAGQQPSNHFNFNTFLMPRRLCYNRNCHCPLQHSELIENSKILTIAVATTNAGNKVSTVGIVDSLSDNNYAVE